MLAASLAAPAVLAQNFGADTAKGSDMINLTGTASETIASVAGQLIGTLLSFLGIIFLILVIVGGFMWMTSQGNDAKVKSAQKLITTAIIGLIIIVSAYAITTFIADNLPK